MKDWYELTNDLETASSPLDEVTERRILRRVQGALPRKRRRLSLAAVIAAVLLLTACGVAVATGQFSQWFWNISEDVRSPEGSESLFAELGTVIGQSQTVDGVTLTLDGALWDGQDLFLSLGVAGLEGEESYSSNVRCEGSWLTGEKESLWEAFQQAYPDVTREDFETTWQATLSFQNPQVTYLYDQENCRIQVYKELTSKSGKSAAMTLHLENLELPGGTVKGPFEFTFTAEPKSLTQVYTGDVTFEQEGKPAVRISEVRVSPFQVEVDFTAQETVNMEDVEIRTLRVGEKESTGSSASHFRVETDEAGNTDYTISDGPFRQIVDPRTVTAIGINGGWLELSQFTLQQ